ncbi:hypothetical protein I8751_22460 [Nostocaceae cyanobacterium CENA357]|uniref:Uncharacterized protein n=1 Tax=Atlanticothrix silvestris CENA357 TaxID=1725252 RepID=A0A8J7HH38_9CYAN|nr:hypothetical protein [Atlanticothrix silvestris]MBH8555059.1 hypothetical protein [Atlanticothrix silvestris CENA357]
MKQQQIILGSITAATSAIALGYLGAQYFAKPTMYAIAGTMLGLGVVGQVTQLKPKLQSPGSARSHSPSFSAIPVTQAQQPMQPIAQTIEQNIGQFTEPHSNEKSIAETDPIIERFVKIGLEEF